MCRILRAYKERETADQIMKLQVSVTQETYAKEWGILHEDQRQFMNIVEGWQEKSGTGVCEKK